MCEQSCQVLALRNVWVRMSPNDENHQPDHATEQQLARLRPFVMEIASKLSYRRQQEAAAWMASLGRPVTDIIAVEIDDLGA